jgi:hypothetical protein
MRVGGIALFLLVAGAGVAAAGPRAVIVAGTSRGGDRQLLPRPAPVACGACFSGAAPQPEATQEGQLATLGVGLVGSEGRARGGGELFTILGMTERATRGYTGVVTYGGFDQGRLFAHAGLGLGSYWGDGRAGTLAALAGDARAEAGVRLHPQWLVVGRADFLLNAVSGATVGTLALQFIP